MLGVPAPVEADGAMGEEVHMIDLENEVERWASRWALLLNRAEGVSWSGCADRRTHYMDYQRDPDAIKRYLAEGVPVLPLVADTWASRAVRQAGVALLFLPSQRSIVGYEVHSGVFALLGCQEFGERPAMEATC